MEQAARCSRRDDDRACLFAVVMNPRLRICPARVSRERHSHHRDRLAIPGVGLRIDSADGQVVLRDLRPEDQHADDDHHNLVRLPVHGQLLDLVSGTGRR